MKENAIAYNLDTSHGMERVEIYDDADVRAFVDVDEFVCMSDGAASIRHMLCNGRSGLLCDGL